MGRRTSARPEPTVPPPAQRRASTRPRCGDGECVTLRGGVRGPGLQRHVAFRGGILPPALSALVGRRVSAPAEPRRATVPAEPRRATVPAEPRRATVPAEPRRESFGRRPQPSWYRRPGTGRCRDAAWRDPGGGRRCRRRCCGRGHGRGRRGRGQRRPASARGDVPAHGSRAAGWRLRNRPCSTARPAGGSRRPPRARSRAEQAAAGVRRHPPASADSSHGSPR
jgi:hypothetical protein